MAIANSTTWDAVIKEVYTERRLTSLVFSNKSLFDFSGYPMPGGDGNEPGYGLPKGLFPVLPSRGGKNWNWPVLYDIEDAETYSEGQGAPAPGSTTPLMASLAYSNGYVQRSIEISGHAIDAARDEGEIVDMFSTEIAGAAERIVDLINVNALGTGTASLGLGIDSAGTYAGLDRSTRTRWGSYEAAVSAALSRSALDDAVEALCDNDRGARIEDLLILCPVNQLTNHGALAGVASTTAMIPINAPGGGKLDLGFTGHSHQGIPMVGIPDMTNTEIFIVHRPSIYWVLHRPLRIEAKPSEGDSMKWLLTCSIIPVVHRPHLCGKLTGVTA